MNIAMVSYWSCPLARLGVGTGGGMSVYVLGLAQALGELGHTVDIYTRTHTDEDDPEEELHPNVTVMHLHQRQSDLYQDIDAFVDQIEEQIHQRQICYEVIHTHYFYSGLVGLKLRERAQIPVFATFHTLGMMKKHYAAVVDQRRIQSEDDIVAGVD